MRCNNEVKRVRQALFPSFISQKYRRTSKIQDTSKKAQTIDKKQQQGDDDNYKTKKQID